MKLFNRSWQMCLFSFRKWSTNHRVWIAIILLFILTHAYTIDYSSFCNNMNIKMSPCIFPFLYNVRYIKILFFSPLLLIFCDAPFIDPSQPYVIYRSGKTAWSIGQILYIMMTSAMYFAFLFLISNLFILNNVDFSIDGWGKAFGTLANTNASTAMGLRTFISKRVLTYFTPWQAVWFTFLLSWLSGTFLGLLMYSINSISGFRSLGIIASAFFIILDAAVLGYPHAVWLSPVSWSSVDNIDIGNMSQLPHIAYVYTAFFLIISVLIASSIITNRKQHINVLQPV